MRQGTFLFWALFRKKNSATLVYYILFRTILDKEKTGYTTQKNKHNIWLLRMLKESHLSLKLSLFLSIWYYKAKHFPLFIKLFFL